MFGEPDFTEEVRALLDKYSLEELLERADIDPIKVVLILIDYGYNQLLDDEQE